MTELKITTKSLWKVELNRCEDGRVFLKDLTGTTYEIRSQRNVPLTEKQYQSILDNQWGFLEIANRFLLIVSGEKV